MSTASTKPVIFISYSHKDEPDHPHGEEVAWLSFVRDYLQPAIKHGVFDLFVDEHVPGGAALKPEIEARLCKCDIFLLLISANSTSSDYIVDTEISITRERQAKGEDVVFYPLLITPTPDIALDKFKGMVIRPKDAKSLLSHPYGERIQAMTASPMRSPSLRLASSTANRRRRAHRNRPSSTSTGCPRRLMNIWSGVMRN